MLSIRIDPEHHTCQESKGIVQERLQEVEARIAELQSMQRSLQRLNDACCGTAHSSVYCSILEALEQGASGVKSGIYLSTVGMLPEAPGHAVIVRTTLIIVSHPPRIFIEIARQIGLVKDILFSSGVGFGIGALFTIVRLPIPVPNVLPGILSIVFMYVGYLVVKYFMP